MHRQLQMASGLSRIAGASGAVSCLHFVGNRPGKMPGELAGWKPALRRAGFQPAGSRGFQPRFLRHPLEETVQHIGFITLKDEELPL
jgi:hypothetical protein